MLSVTIIKGFVDKVQKCLKPSTAIAATTPSQIITFHCFFFASGRKLYKNELICFLACFVKSVDKTQVKFFVYQ